MQPQTRPEAIPRRTFLGAAAGAGLATLSAKSYGRVIGANDRLNIGFIGCGSIATAHRYELLKLHPTENFRFSGVCDVWTQRAQAFRDVIQSAGAGEPQVFQDYRELLEAKDLDYVSIHTPEHWHAQQILDSLEAGKHVYCEKPMTHKLDEAKAVLEKARSSGLKVQIGVQGMSDARYRAAYEAIRAGKLGPLIHAQIDYVRNYSPQTGPWRAITADMPQPPDLDWQGWLGPAPQRDWDAHRFYEWRCYRDYSGGIATDLFVHRITRIIRACGLAEPKSVIGMGGIRLWPDGRELPDNFEMLVEYPAVEGITPGMTVHLLGTMANKRGIEHLIRGHEATLIFSGKTSLETARAATGVDGWQIISERSGKVLETFQTTGGEEIGLHHKNHFEAIRHGTELNCPPELGFYGLLPVLMGNESWFQQKLLVWDAERASAVPA